MTNTTIHMRRRCLPVMMLACSALFVAPLRMVDAQGAPPTPPRTPARRPAPAPARAPMPRPAPAAPLTPLAPSSTGEFRWPGFAPSADIAMDLDIAREQAMSIAAEVKASMSAEMMAFPRAEALGMARLAMDEARVAALASVDAMDVRGQVEAAMNGLSFARAWSDQGRGATRIPRESWSGQDPADSIYREARKALSRDSYRRAADLFRRIRDQYPKSAYTPDAPYWEAYALQRLGASSDLRVAKEALAWQEKQYPKAPTRADAAALATRIDGALARGGDRAAAATLYGQAARASNDGCPRQSDDERVDALNALMQVDAERAMPILKKVLARREPCTQNMRRTAVWLIASRKAPDAAEVLMNVAKTDPDSEVREQAVFWLANVPTDQAADMLIGLAKGDGDMDLRKRAVYALSRSKSSKSATTLREIAADAGAPVELRSDALSWYMSGPGKSLDDPMSFLKDVYGKADEQRFKERVLYTIAQRRTDASRDFVFAVAQNQKESMETRRAAVSQFSMMNVTGAQIAAVYERSSEVEIKRQLLASLASLSSRRGREGEATSDGIDQLLEIVRNEKNVELRKQAIAMLSRSKDPRALALLQEIIER